MNTFDILETICDNIHEQFPVNPIYIQNTPQGFARPSFYVSIVGFSDSDFSNGTLYRNIAFQVVFFAPKNGDVVDVVSQYTSYITLSELFTGQSLKVKDRYIKIKSVDGGPRDAEVYLTANFEYAYIPTDIMNPEEVHELMLRLEMKYNNIQEVIE